MSEKINGTTCWKEHQQRELPCQKMECRQWMNCKNKLNCAIVASQDGPRTLQEIGDLHSLTRMRICQIEKEALRKIRELVFDS
jgi:hypothetical protein